MNYPYILGLLMFMASGIVLHDVSLPRYIFALLLISAGTILGIWSRNV